MMATDRVSTGMRGFDEAIDMLRLGDNVVWQVKTVEDYIHVTEPFIRQTREDGRRLVYFRFGTHPPLMEKEVPDAWYEPDASGGFESFATKVYNIIAEEGRGVFYIFDCLSDLLEYWYSDLMIGNFFRIVCPFLFKLDTIAYFALKQGVHTYSTIARIRETTQLLLDLHIIDGNMYIHPLKVWERYSPTMFFPHLIREDKSISITSSAEAAELFSSMGGVRQARDFWEVTLDRARSALQWDESEQVPMKELLISLILGRESRMAELCKRYFMLSDLVGISSREVGTGLIGGKSVGMLLARKILKTKAWDALKDHWESHDSYYLGADIFYTYIVQNGWWELRTRQKTPDGYFTLREELRENLLTGRFSADIREQFRQVLEHFGQSPIIVRSSSLLEDNFGNAFAGKYESVFCVNQGPPEERYDAFENAVRAVYASTMNIDALNYRKDRDLMDRDEQMAILVQRVSGDHYDDLFFPHVAGVGNSVNLYLWNRDLDPEAGMLRLVFGLGTRAVDRQSGDYARIVSLDCPEKGPPINYGDERKFSQHGADVLNLRKNLLEEIPLNSLLSRELLTDTSLFFSPDMETARRLSEIGRFGPTPMIADFQNLLSQTSFPSVIKRVLTDLRKAYDYPVDTEFTVNFFRDGSFKINLLQCRPLQTRGLGRAAVLPEPEPERTLFGTSGDFMGGNVHIQLDYAVLVRPREYLALTEQGKYQVARVIGELNRALCPDHVLLVGPGRWGTTTPSLGVPVHFTELSHMSAVCEVSHREAGMMPELSFGSHFFQDIVETGIFYAAIFEGKPDILYQPEQLLGLENHVYEFINADESMRQVVHVAKTPGLTLYSDISSQTLRCFWK